ncbi:helix-turn-helix domain-containing protein [Flavihumibacter sp. R14]|nr:helix-turn-helix domain-containing protein [Flavihumibacter soli]
MDNAKRFILKPTFNNLTEQGLNYKDILTYVAIRSYYNTRDKYCYPSYKTLEKRTGLSSKFISQSIMRLDKAGYLHVWKLGKGRVQHCYKFPDNGTYHKIPYDLLEDKSLNPHEKSMLLLLREYCSDDLVSDNSIREIASLSGLTYRTIHKQFQALTLKGFIRYEEIENTESKTISKVFGFTDKINWQFNDGSIKIVGNSAFNVDSIIDMWANSVRCRYANNKLIAQLQSG